MLAGAGGEGLNRSVDGGCSYREVEGVSDLRMVSGLRRVSGLRMKETVGSGAGDRACLNFWIDLLASI